MCKSTHSHILKRLILLQNCPDQGRSKLLFSFGLQHSLKFAQNFNYNAVCAAFVVTLRGGTPLTGRAAKPAEHKSRVTVPAIHPEAASDGALQHAEHLCR